MPDDVSTLAISALESAVSSLLPSAVPPGLTRSLRVSPRSVAPLGVGGYVGSHREPGAAMFGRRVRARIDVGISGGAETAAASYVAALSGQMLAFTRAEFAGLGIHRLTGIDADGARDLAFDVDFEFVPVPATGEGVIDNLALQSYTNLTPYRTRLVADFAGAGAGTQAEVRALQPSVIDSPLPHGVPPSSSSRVSRSSRRRGRSSQTARHTTSWSIAA
jgi:hypothetical protein